MRNLNKVRSRLSWEKSSNEDYWSGGRFRICLEQSGVYRLTDFSRSQPLDRYRAWTCDYPTLAAAQKAAAGPESSRR